MPKRRKRPTRPKGRYRPSAIPGLGLYPTILLLNLMVRTPEDHAKTDGPILRETVDIITALIRHTYDLADLDRERGRGAAISLIGQFFHPDDYTEHRIAEIHVQTLRSALEGNRKPPTLPRLDLRTLEADVPPILAQGDKQTLTVYYKQRFLSICFAGQGAELDKLRGNVPSGLWERILGTLWHALDISDEVFVLPHPTFVPVARVHQVAQRNARQWARQMTEMKQGFADRDQETRLTFTDPSGAALVFRPRKRPTEKR